MANRFVAPVMAVVDVAGEAGAPLFAASLAFSTLFAIVPIVLLLAGVLGVLIADPVQRQQLLDQLISLVPPLEAFFSDALNDVVAARGALSLVGLVGLLWGSSAFYGGLDEVMRRIFTGGTIRDQISRRLRGVLVVFILVALVFGTAALGGVWAVIESIVGNLAIWSVAVPLIVVLVMILVAIGTYTLVPTAPASVRAALLPAIVAGAGIGILTNLFGVLTPLLIGGLSGFGVIASVFGLLVWLNFSYQILLYGAAWARIRRDRENDLAAVIAN